MLSEGPFKVRVGLAKEEDCGENDLVCGEAVFGELTNLCSTSDDALSRELVPRRLFAGAMS